MAAALITTSPKADLLVPPSLAISAPIKSQFGIGATQTDFRIDYLRLGAAVDDGSTIICPSVKRKSPGEDPENTVSREIKKAKLETKALKAKRPGFTDERYNETSYYVENGLRKVYPYYFTFTTFTKGRWVGEKILDVFAREFRAHPVEEYERCIKSGTLTVNYTKVETDYRLKHNDLLANIVHRHEVPVTSDPIEVIFMDEELVVVNKPASIPVHPCGRYRHNTVVFILAKEHQLKNLRTIHRLDRLTSGLLLFGRSPKKAREMEHQIRNRLVQKEYVCRVEGDFPDDEIECEEPIEVVSYKIGVCKVSKDGKDCRTVFKKLSFNGKTSVVIARPRTGRMHQIRVHLQYLGYPIVNDPLYNHPVFGPDKGKGGLMGKTDEELIAQLISIHNAENWLGIEGEETGGAPMDIFGPPLPIQPSSGQSSDPTEAEREQGADAEPEMLRASSSPSSANTERPEPISILPSIDRNAEELKPEPELVSSGAKVTVTVGTQTGEEETLIRPISVSPSTSTSSSTCDNCSSTASVSSPTPMTAPTGGSTTATTSLSTFRNSNMTHDPHCYECKVRYRDPKAKDLVMYLHALSYRGPGWCYETKLPAWAAEDWIESDETL